MKSARSSQKELLSDQQPALHSGRKISEKYQKKCLQIAKLGVIITLQVYMSMACCLLYEIPKGALNTRTDLQSLGLKGPNVMGFLIRSGTFWKLI
jgi:hypothetical protein